MHPLVNHLLQLQELVLIRDEQKVAGNAQHLDQLDASIRTLTAKLPDDVRDQFEKLQQKNHTAVTPISENTCAVCGMRIPISQVQQVRQGKQILACPTCARILYYPQAPVRRVGERKRRRDMSRKEGISRFSSRTLMVPRLEGRSAEEAIRELAEKMEGEGFINSADRLVEEALRREAVLSTAVSHGLAFPHVRHVEGGGLTLAMGISRKGIRFGGPGRTLTRIVFLLAIPTAVSAFYLKLLAGLTETFRDAGARETLMAETEPEGLWKALIKLTRKTVK